MTRRPHTPVSQPRPRRIAALVPAALLSVGLALGLAACGSSPPADSATPTVVRVVDGDTVVVRSGGTEESVRLIGVDTPETKHPTKPVQCFGKEASAFTASVLPPGTAVRLERDVEEHDRYDRLLVYLYRVDDGAFVNLELARQGFAGVLTIPPNVAHTSEFVAAAAEARRAGRGLWGACGDVGVPAS